jgi:hypothetical protein
MVTTSEKITEERNANKMLRSITVGIISIEKR